MHELYVFLTVIWSIFHLNLFYLNICQIDTSPVIGQFYEMIHVAYDTAAEPPWDAKNYKAIRSLYQKNKAKWIFHRILTIFP